MTQTTKITKQQLLDAIVPHLAAERAALKNPDALDENGTWSLPEFATARDLTEQAGISWDFRGWDAAVKEIKGNGTLGGEAIGLYEVRLSDVPEGAYTEDYLGMPRYFDTREQADACVAQFGLARAAHPQNFEDGMEAEVVEL